MTRRTVPAQINASLLRELRLIAQSFFISRSVERSSSNRHMPSRQASTFKCVPCMRNDPRTAKSAVAIEDGYSVCADHIRN